jgi:hypothetical protein
LIVIISVTASLSSLAQSNLLNAKIPEEIGLKTAAQLISDNDKPLAYGYVHDRDVLMGKMTWEIIDLSEKINFPLYFLIDTANIGSDRLLYDVLTKQFVTVLVKFTLIVTLILKNRLRISKLR